MNKVETQTVAEFKPETWGAFINGEFVPATSGKTLRDVQPRQWRNLRATRRMRRGGHRESGSRSACRLSSLAQEDRRGTRQGDHEAGSARRSARAQARRT